MIYLLYGSDTRASLKKLNEIVSEYRKKYGELNIHRFDAEEDEAPKIKNILGASSLFSPKKLVVIRNISTYPYRETLHKWLEDVKNSADTLVVVVERELLREKLAEFKNFCDKVQEFKEKVPSPADDKAIFRLGDTFFTNRKEGLKILLGLIEQGHEERIIFSYLTNHLRTLMLVKYFNDRQKTIPSAYKIHPYVAQKAKAIVQGLAPDYLSKFLYKFFEEDLKIKIGDSSPRESLVKMLVTKF